MKTLVIYYSLTGKTNKIAKEKAAELGSDIIEIQEVKKCSVFSAYIFGAYAAIKNKKANIKDLNCDLSCYEKIVIAMPIWAGNPVPPFNNLVEMLPQGKVVEVIMTSGGGDSSSSKEKTIDKIKARGCDVVSYTDIKTYEKKKILSL